MNDRDRKLNVPKGRLPGGTRSLDSGKPGTEDTSPGAVGKLDEKARGTFLEIGKIRRLDSGKEGQGDTGPGLAHGTEHRAKAHKPTDAVI